MWPRTTSTMCSASACCTSAGTRSRGSEDACTHALTRREALTQGVTGCLTAQPSAAAYALSLRDVFVKGSDLHVCLHHVVLSAVSITTLAFAGDLQQRTCMHETKVSRCILTGRPASSVSAPASSASSSTFFLRLGGFLAGALSAASLHALKVCVGGGCRQGREGRGCQACG
jgi:hypothetical protein